VAGDVDLIHAVLGSVWISIVIGWCVSSALTACVSSACDSRNKALRNLLL
jgi:hypothetical protein